MPNTAPAISTSSASANRYIVDTHALIWWTIRSSKLSAAAAQVLDDPQSDLCVPAIVLAEIAWMAENKPKVRLPPADVAVRQIWSDPRVAILPLDAETVQTTTLLSSIGEMHDRQIVATAMNLAASGHSVTLLTNDRNIAASGLVPVLW